MTESAVRLGDAGELFLSGVLDYRTGPDLRKQGQALIKASTAPALVLDCSAVHQVQQRRPVVAAVLHTRCRSGQEVGQHSRIARRHA